MAIFHVLIGDQAASLPMDSYEAEQLLYDLGLDMPDVEYEMELVDSDYLLALDSNFRELNHLAQRMNQMGDFDRETFGAWVDAQDTCSVKDALRASFHLDMVELHPGFDNDEMLGDHALDNGLCTEYADLSDDVYTMLDRAKVGAGMREQDGGVFVNGGYLVAASMDGLDNPQEEPLPWFQVSFSDGWAKEGYWEELPYTSEEEYDIACFFERKDLTDLKMACRSSIPQLSGLTSESTELPDLRDMAEALSEMSSDDLMKYKALLEVMKPESVCEALRLADDIGQYEVALDYADPAVYGLQHAMYRYGLDEDCQLLDFVDVAAYGAAMLQEDGYTQTRYGAVYTEDMACDEVMTEEQAQDFDGMSMQ